MKMKEMYIGVDIGSVSINVVAVDKDMNLLFKLYERNLGQPVDIVKKGLSKLHGELKDHYQIKGLGVTGSGRQLKPQYIFQGGVAANIGIKTAFEEEVGHQVIVPEYYDVMGAIGIARLTREHIVKNGLNTQFKGFSLVEDIFETSSFICHDCSNNCEVIKTMANGNPIAMTGDRCGKWSNSILDSQELETASNT